MNIIWLYLVINQFKGFLEARQSCWEFLNVKEVEKRVDTAKFIEETIVNRTSYGGSDFDATKDLLGILWAAGVSFYLLDFFRKQTLQIVLRLLH